VATGESRAIEAAKKAVSSPLLETSIDGAEGILMNISGGPSLSLFEVQEAADLVTSAASDEVNVIFGNVINENLKEEVIVTVIATGFSDAEKPNTQMGARPRKVHHQHAASQQPIENQETEPAPDETFAHDEDTLDIP